MNVRVLLLLVFVVCLFACSSSLTDDARKMAEFECRWQELTVRIMREDEKAKKALDTLLTQREQFYKEMEQKYNAPERQKLEEEASRLSRKCWH